MRSCWLLALTAGACLAADTRADDLTIYRCIDAKGKLTLRDSPCQRGDKQETRDMVRPQDPPARRIDSQATTAPAPVYRESVRYVMLTPPRPLYECTAPDGRRYSSESAEGQPRWQPLWAAAYPAYPPVRVASGGASINYQSRHGALRIDHRREVIGAPAQIGYTYPVAAGGYWAPDSCVALPAAEICARLSDRRHEIRRRYVHAMPSERQALDRESATLDNRLATECTQR